MISTVNGSFRKFDASMESSKDDFTDAVLKFSADIESIATGVADRDSHLRSSEVFDCYRWPKITFESSNIAKISSWQYEIIGDLTIKDVSLPVKLFASYDGVVTDGSSKLGHAFQMRGVLSRKEYGLNFNLMGLGGNVLVDDVIQLFVKVVAVKKDEKCI